VVLGLVGLLVGWLVRGQAIRAGAAPPTVTWLLAAATWFIAAITAAVAYLTWRAVHRERTWLSPEQGLTRLVLGRTMSRVGSFACGGFVGSAISYLGVADDSAGAAMLRALVAALGAAVALGAGLLLEHACRVPRDDA
jgi:hypothetical protein